MPERVSVEIPKELYEKLASKVENSTFASVGELIESVLSEFLRVEDERKIVPLDEKEQKEMEDRLKRLGYE